MTEPPRTINEVMDRYNQASACTIPLSCKI